MKNLIIYLLLTLNSCVVNKENNHRSILFVNNSNRGVYILYSFDYPNTQIIKHTPTPLISGINYKVEPKTASDEPLLRRPKSGYEATMEYSGAYDTLMVYVFDAELVETKKWSDITHNDWILRRYDLSLQDLKNRNWTIIYP